MITRKWGTVMVVVVVLFACSLFIDNQRGEPWVVVRIPQSPQRWDVVSYINQLNCGKIPLSFLADAGTVLRDVNIAWKVPRQGGENLITFVGGMVWEGYLPIKRYNFPITHIDRLEADQTVEVWYGLPKGRFLLGSDNLVITVTGTAESLCGPFSRSVPFVKSVVIPFVLDDLPFGYVNPENTSPLSVSIAASSDSLENKALKVYDWMINNLEYKDDPDGHWQSSQETLELMAGDCEDFATLFYSLLRCLGASPSESRIAIDLGIGHAYNELRDGDAWRRVDVASRTPPFEPPPITLTTHLAFSEDYFWNFMEPQAGGLYLPSYD